MSYPPPQGPHASSCMHDPHWSIINVSCVSDMMCIVLLHAFENWGDTGPASSKALSINHSLTAFVQVGFHLTQRFRAHVASV